MIAHRSRLVRSAVVFAAFALRSAPVAAQGKRAPAKATHPAAAALSSTLVGVYTADQADRGKDVYAGNCRSCHTPASHTGATFAQWWKGKRLSDLYEFIAVKMPKNDPGSLSAEDAADVVAYLLRMNAMPTGKGELPPDPDSLKHFRIETKRAAAASAATTAPRKKP